MYKKIILSFCLILPFTALSCAQDKISDAERTKTETIIKAYLLENPEIIEEALIALHNKREAEKGEASRAMIAANTDVLYQNAADYAIGPEDAAITLVEFFDYRCGYCRKAVEAVSALPEKYDGQVRIVFKEFPILSETSHKAAIAALAAGRQGKYFEIHQAFMKTPTQLTEADILKIGEDIGLDIEAWKQDRTDPALSTQITRTQSLARRLGVNATPAFITDETLITGLDMAQLSKMIETQLAEIG